MRPATSQGFYLHHLPHYAMLAPALEGARLLQLGGGGYTASYAQHLGAQVTCVLPTHEEVNNEAAIYGGTGIELTAAPGPMLPFPDKSFDVIIAFDVSPREGSFAGLVNELRRLLTRDGFAVLTLPNYLRDDLKEVMGEGAIDRELHSPGSLQAALSRRFSSVSMLAQSPFMGYHLSQIDGNDQALDISDELLGGRPEEVLYYGFLVSDLRIVLEEDRLIRVPFSHVVDRLQDGLRTFHRALEQKNSAILELREEVGLLHRRNDELGTEASLAQAQLGGTQEKLNLALKKLKTWALAEAGADEGPLQEIITNLSQPIEIEVEARAHTPQPSGGHGATGVSADEMRLLMDGLAGGDIDGDLEALDASFDDDGSPHLNGDEGGLREPPRIADPVFQEDLAPFRLPGPVPLATDMRARVQRLKERVHEQQRELMALGGWKDALEEALSDWRRHAEDSVVNTQGSLSSAWADLVQAIAQLQLSAGFITEGDLPQRRSGMPEGEDPTHRIKALEAELAEASARIEQLKQALDASETREIALSDKLQEAEAQVKAKTRELVDARAKLIQGDVSLDQTDTDGAAPSQEDSDAAAPTPEDEAGEPSPEESAPAASPSEVEAQDTRSDGSPHPPNAPEDLTSDADAPTPDRDDHREALALLQREADELRQRLEESEKDRSRLQDELAQALSAPKEASDKGSATDDAGDEALKSELSTLKETVERQAEELSTQKEAQSKLAQALADKEAALGEQADEALDLKDSLEEKEAQIAELTAQLSPLKASIAEKDDAIEALKAEVAPLNERLAKREQEVAELNEELRKAWSQSLAEATVTVADEEEAPPEDLEQLSDPVRQLESRVETLLSELEEREGQVAELKDEIELKNTHARSLQAIIDRQNISLDGMKARIRTALQDMETQGEASVRGLVETPEA